MRRLAFLACSTAALAACTGPAPAFAPGAAVATEAVDASLLVSWPAADDDNLHHYDVTVDGKPYTTTSTPTVVIADRPVWSKLALGVVAVDDDGQRSRALAGTARMPDVTPPRFADDGGPRRSDDGKSVSWTPPTDDGVLAHLHVFTVKSAGSADPLAKPTNAPPALREELSLTTTTWTIPEAYKDEPLHLEACDAAGNCANRVVEMSRASSAEEAARLAAERHKELRDKIAAKGLLALIGAKGAGGSMQVADVFGSGSTLSGGSFASAFDDTRGVGVATGVGRGYGGGGGGGTVGSLGGGAVARRKDGAATKVRVRPANVVGIDPKAVARQLRRRTRDLRSCVQTHGGQRAATLKVSAQEGDAVVTVTTSSGSKATDRCLQDALHAAGAALDAAGSFDVVVTPSS